LLKLDDYTDAITNENDNMMWGPKQKALLEYMKVFARHYEVAELEKLITQAKLSFNLQTE
jgi:hypothetical protein